MELLALSKSNSHILILAAVTIASILAVWSPFARSGRMDEIFRYWDGPSYVTTAFAFYARQNPVYAAYGFGPDFYATTFPAYPFLIRMFSFIGYFNSMLFITVLSSILAVLAFYFLAKEYLNGRDALFLSAVFVFFPARWWLYHSVGASEPLFLFAVLSSIYFFRKKNIPYAVAFALLATLTRVNGVLLFPALAFLLWEQDRRKFTLKNAALLCAIPLALGVLFYFYWLQFGNFLAAFKINSMYVKGLFSAITTFGGPQAGEFTLLLFGLYAAGIARLWQRKRLELFIPALLFFTPILFLAHNDLSRYLLPAAPFALLLAFDDLIVPMVKRKSFWLVFALFAAASLVYFANVLPQNLMPDWAFQNLVRIIGG